MHAKKRKRPIERGWVFFWLAFIVGVSLLFALNLGKIRDTIKGAGILDRFGNTGEISAEEEQDQVTGTSDLALLTEGGIAEQDGISGQSGLSEQGGLAEQGGIAEQGSIAEQGELPDLAGILNELAEQNAAAQGNNTVLGGGAEQASINIAVPSALAVPGNAVQERTVYLLRVDNTGTILWTQVKRNLPASNTPLRDTLEALIRGPSEAEERQGFISLIPQNVRIINAIVRGNTAYINFNEDFLYNSYGVEGYSGQRRQIVLTATEFSNIDDVQILIDGKRVDFLGEGIWIGSPVNRNML